MSEEYLLRKIDELQTAIILRRTEVRNRNDFINRLLSFIYFRTGHRFRFNNSSLDGDPEGYFEKFKKVRERWDKEDGCDSEKEEDSSVGRVPVVSFPSKARVPKGRKGREE